MKTKSQTQFQNLVVEKKDHQLRNVILMFVLVLLFGGFVEWGGIDWAGRIWGSLVSGFWDLVLKVFY